MIFTTHIIAVGQNGYTFTLCLHPCNEEAQILQGQTKYTSKSHESWAPIKTKVDPLAVVGLVFNKRPAPPYPYSQKSAETVSFKLSRDVIWSPSWGSFWCLFWGLFWGCLAYFEAHFSPFHVLSRPSTCALALSRETIQRSNLSSAKCVSLSEALSMAPVQTCLIIYNIFNQEINKHCQRKDGSVILSGLL